MAFPIIREQLNLALGDAVNSSAFDTLGRASQVQEFPRTFVEQNYHFLEDVEDENNDTY